MYFVQKNKLPQCLSFICHQLVNHVSYTDCRGNSATFLSFWFIDAHFFGKSSGPIIMLMLPSNLTGCRHDLPAFPKRPKSIYQGTVSTWSMRCCEAAQRSTKTWPQQKNSPKDGKKSGDHQLRWVARPIIHNVLYRFILVSQVQDFSHLSQYQIHPNSEVRPTPSFTCHHLFFWYLSGKREMGGSPR